MPPDTLARTFGVPDEPACIKMVPLVHCPRYTLQPGWIWAVAMAEEDGAEADGEEEEAPLLQLLALKVPLPELMEVEEERPEAFLLTQAVAEEESEIKALLLLQTLPTG